MLKNGLYVVATPIGNIKDISARALQVLETTDIIACEDTRVSKKLFTLLGLKTDKKFICCEDHREENVAHLIVDIIKNGQTVALISDAGSPLISDPGYKLVRLCKKENITVFTIPGASAVICALQLSGLPTNRFMFAGFIENKAKARLDLFEELKNINTTLVFYETAPRLIETLKAAKEVFGTREIAIAREITKIYEECLNGTADELIDHFESQPPKGEIVLMIAPPDKENIEIDVEKELKIRLKTMSLKTAATEVAALSGKKKNEIYALGLLSDEQVNRIISYTASLGRHDVAVIVPDTPAGLNIAKSAFDAAASQNITVTKIAFYEPSTLEFSELVQKISQNKDFDTVLIAETGSRLKAIAGTFGYYDIDYPDVIFIGTSVWENTNLSKETTLYNAVYPVISRVHGDYFNNKYKDLFGEVPNSLYAYAYDGVALASALSKNSSGNLYEAIVDPDGYIGINGSFRFFEDGMNEHNLDVVEVTAQGLKIVSSAPRNFGLRGRQGNSVSNVRPEIYGKSADEVYRKLFPVQEMPSYFDMF